MGVILGFDTSCYTTSAAAASEEGEILASSRLLLPVGEGQRGLRQSEAVFAHVRQMPGVARELGARGQIVAVCASGRPRDDEDSYMPVFTVGLGHAKALAGLLGVPFFETTHQRGHIAAGCIGQTDMGERFVALHLSGGTTDLLCKDGDALLQLGGSLDLHAGQLVDRVGVKLGLPFPAGPGLERLALEGRDTAEGLLPASMTESDLRCHLSGAETRAVQWIDQKTFPPEKIAAEVFDLLARTVARLLAAGCTQAGMRKALVIGGVASSGLLRELTAARLQKLRAPVELRFGQKRFSADNAAGVAMIGLEQYQKRKEQEE